MHRNYECEIQRPIAVFHLSTDPAVDTESWPCSRAALTNFSTVERFKMFTLTFEMIRTRDSKIQTPYQNSTWSHRKLAN